MNEAEKDEMLQMVHTKAAARAKKTCSTTFNSIRKLLRAVHIRGGNYDLAIERTEGAAGVELLSLLYSLEEIAVERMTEEYISQILRNAASEPKSSKEKPVE